MKKKKCYHTYCLKRTDKSKGLFSLFTDKCTSDDSRVKTLKFDNKTAIYDNSCRFLSHALLILKDTGISEKFLILHITISIVCWLIKKQCCVVVTNDGCLGSASCIQLESSFNNICVSVSSLVSWESNLFTNIVMQIKLVCVNCLEQCLDIRIVIWNPIDYCTLKYSCILLLLCM